MEQNPQEQTLTALSHMILNPTCCQDHRVPCSQSKSIDVSEWKFPLRYERPDSTRAYDPFSRLTPLHQRKKVEMEVFEKELELFRLHGYVEQLMLSLDPGVVEKVAALLDIDLPPSTERIQERSSSADTLTPSTATTFLLDHSKDEMSDFEMLSSESSPAPYGNPYLTLLRRLEREEREKKSPDEDLELVKAVERDLQEMTSNFSQWTCTIDKVISSGNDSDEDEPVIDVATIRKLFNVVLGKPALCPHIPVVVKEVKQKPHPVFTKPKPQPKIEPVKGRRKRQMHVAWYLSPTLWFRQWTAGQTARPTVYQLTPDEDKALINVKGIRDFFRYLEAKNVKPSKVITDLLAAEKMMKKDFK